MNASGIGDISTDDNAVDIPIKPEDEAASFGLTNNNDRIPILDDDDDVIVLPQEEPVITEIPDDDDHDHKDASTSKECSTNSQGDSVGNAASKMDATTNADNLPNNVNADDDGIYFLLFI